MRLSYLTIILLYIHVLVASTCKKHDELSTLTPFPGFDDPTIVPLDTIWRRMIDSISFDVASITPIINSKGDIIVSNFGTRLNREPIMLFDGKTGEKKWEWQDYFRDEIGFFNRKHLVDNDILVLGAYNATYALDMVTGQTLWRHFMPTGYGSPFIFKDDRGYVYHIFSGEDGDFSNYIYRTRINQLNWELICTLKDSINLHFSRRMPENISFTYNTKGEQLMLFTLTLFNTSIDGNTFLACYNINEKKYEWVRNYYQDYNEWGHTNMHVYNNMIVAYAYLGNHRYLTGINLENGNIEWKQRIERSGVGLFTFNDKVISTLNGENPVRCYDSKTGQIIWEQKFTPEILQELNFSFGDVTIYKNYLFSTQCKRLVVLNLIDGNVVYNERISTGCLEYGAVVDEHNKTFFVVDGTYINCYKLPKEIQF
jgi:outer membrane protein assembly factor BamB